MHPHETSAEALQGKFLKVRLRADTHVKLHSLKILTGKSISDTVDEALARYLSTAMPPGADVWASRMGEVEPPS